MKNLWGLLLLIACNVAAQNSTNDHLEWSTTKAEAYLATGEYQQAIAYCSAHIKANPEGYYAYGLRGIAYYNRAKAQHAYEDLTIALTHFPTEEFYYYRSRVRNQANYKGVLSDLTAAIAISPNQSRYYYERGMLHWKAFAETAERHNNYTLDFISKRIGFTPDPCSDFEQATSLNTEYEKTIELCERFQLMYMD